MYFQVFSDNDFSPLAIDCIGFGKDVNVTRFGPGQRDLYIVHYVIKGNGYYNGNSVNQGQGFLIYPGQLEEYFPDKDDPWEFLWFVSHDDKMSKLFSGYRANPETYIFDYDSISETERIANEIIHKNNEILNSLKMLEMFLNVFNSHSCNQSKNYKKNSDIYLDFSIKYIKTHIQEKISVTELTEILGISQAYLYQIFNNKFGMSTKKYITWYKLNHAKKLLTKTDMTITQIANSVGYDVLSFSKLFSLNEGVSPQKYRTMH